MPSQSRYSKGSSQYLWYDNHLHLDDVDDDEYDDDGENGKACERDEDSQRMIPQSTANSPLIKRFQSFPTNLEHLGHFGIFCAYK